MQELSTLRTAKQALEENLITQSDFETVKQGFLNAQRIKAGLDAGFIQEDDFAAASAAFFESLGVCGSATKQQPGSQPVKKAQNGGGSAFARAANAPAVANQKPTVQLKGEKPAGLAQRVNSLPTPTKPVVPSAKVSMAGIAVDENAIAEFNNMKSKSVYLWMMFKMDSAGRTVVLSETAGSTSNLNDFQACLPQDECRYAVYDYPYQTSEGRRLQKLVFISWSPDTAPTKSKMMFASTKEFFKNSLGGTQVEIQVSDLDDLGEDDISKAVGATLTRG